MKTIFVDKFTESIAVGCSEEESIIDYFGSVKEALDRYPNAVVSCDMDTMHVSIDANVTIETTNQKLILTKQQALALRAALKSL